tara:strand:+ start:184 stop:900 length:717 start_codon:yes stop_codon:yes gene_type:complete
MIYQIVSLHRTGTHLLGEYTSTYDKAFLEYGVPEIFNHGWNITDNELCYTEFDPMQDALSNINLIELKFDWLEKQKKNNIHYPNIINNLYYREMSYSNFTKRLIKYYKGYHVLTINRNSWDRFKSFQYQVCTQFQQAHIFKQDKKYQPSADFKINVNEKVIKTFISHEIAHYKLLNHVLENVNYTIIEYKDLNETYLNNFFKVENISIKCFPMNIEYEQYIVDVNYWKKYYKQALRLN